MIALDRKADTFPVGLAGTPFEEVYRALRTVAATVWDIDPLVYRAGMAWGWYALHDPSELVGFRDVVTAALISEIAPMVKDTQTDSELVEYLRQWRSYTPTFPKLQAIYALFGAVVDIQPISDPESQSVLPVDDTRLAFYIRIESVDFSRPLSLSDAREIAVRATPLGSRPYPYYALETHIPCAVSPAPVGIYIRLDNWETARPPAPPQQLGDVIFVDADGRVTSSVDLDDSVVFTPTGYFTIEDDAEVAFVEESPYPTVCQYSETHYGEVQDDAGVTLALPYYSTQKLYTYEVIAIGGNQTSGWEIVDDNGFVKVVNRTGAAVTAIVFVIRLIDATDASVVDVEYISTGFRALAFKWTDSGTDYYFIPFYEEQTVWTDDLSSIGWQEVPAGYIDVLLGLKYNNGDWVAVDVSNDYYWAGILDSTDQSRLSALGLVESGSSYPYKELFYSLEYDYTFVALYSDMGETAIATIPSDFSVAGCSEHGGHVATIVCTGTYGTLAKAWKCRISTRTLYKLYLKADQSKQYMYEYTWYTLYDEDGNQATSVPDTYHDSSMRQYFIGYYQVNQTEIKTGINSAFDFIMQNGVPKARVDRNYAYMIGFVFSSLNP